MSGMEICKYSNFSGTVPPVVENIPFEDRYPTIDNIMPIQPVIFKLLLYIVFYENNITYNLQKLLS